MTTVTENLDLPGGADPSSAVVTLKLVGANGTQIEGFYNGTTIVGVVVPAVASDGTWSTTALAPNASINPSGSAWRRIVTLAGKAVADDYLTVPASGSYRVDQILTTQPASILPSGAVARGGDTMTGPLILSGDPTVGLGAATMQYADALSDALDVRLDAVEAGKADLVGGTVPDAQLPAGLARDSEVTAAVAAHEADTTNVHGIADTALLETTSGAQMKVDTAITAIKNGAPASGDTLGELHTRLAVVEALGSLATDAELVAAVAALIGSADTAGDTLGELQALIGLRLLKSANLSDLANVSTALTNLGFSAFAKTLIDDADAATARATLGVVSNAAYNATSWNGVADVAPSQDAVRDKIEALSGATLHTSATVRSILDYGADPTGVAASDTAIAAAYTAATTVGPGVNGQVYWPAGTYKCASTVIITAPTVADSGAVLNSDANPAVQIGDGTNILYDAEIKLPQVEIITKDWGISPGPGAGTIGTKVGVEVNGTRYCKITIPTIHNFSIGLKLTGGTLGALYNDINLGWLRNNAIAIRFVAGAGSAVNNFQFYGGRTSIESAEGTNLTGVIGIDLQTGSSLPNNNQFFGTSLEGDGHQYKIKCQGADNTFYNCRFEFSAVTPKVLYDGSSTKRNVLFGGYSVRDVVFTQTNSAVGNTRVFAGLPAFGGRRRFTASKFFIPAVSAAAGLDQAQNGMTLIPFWVSEVMTVQSLSVNVTQAAASATVRLGIYASAEDDRPTGAPLVDTGAVIDASTTGNKTATANLPVTLGPGLYWLAAVYQGAAAVKLLTGSGSDPTILLNSLTAALSVSPHNGYYVTGVTAGLPTSPSTGATTNGCYIVAVGT